MSLNLWMNGAVVLNASLRFPIRFVDVDGKSEDRKGVVEGLHTDTKLE